MKTSNKLAIGAAIVAGAFSYWATTTKGDQTWLQEIHRTVGIGVQCEKTELNDLTWMACRYEQGRDQGSAWLLAESDQGEAWIARNSPAIRVEERWQALPEEERISPIQIRQSPPGENLPSSVPWEELN